MEHGRLIVRVPVGEQTDAAELLMAEAWGAGALGIEEAEDADRVVLTIYASSADLPGLQATLSQHAPEGVAFECQDALPEVDWSEAWKRGLEPIVVSERLVVRPSFTGHACAPGQAELIIDPGQAFGTGGHASTLLILRWLDVLATEGLVAKRVLDVGTGTAVSVTFSGALDRGKFDPGLVKLYADKTPVAGSAELDSDGKSLLFRPARLLAEKKPHRLEVTPGLIDRFGNRMTEAFASRFVTLGDTRSEFYSEPTADDPYVCLLRRTIPDHDTSDCD